MANLKFPLARGRLGLPVKTGIPLKITRSQLLVAPRGERNGALCEVSGYDEGANPVERSSGQPREFPGEQVAPRLDCFFWYDGGESAALIPAEIH